MSEFAAILRKASENIEAAEMLLLQGFYDISASRSYYAMFYLAQALLFTKGLAFSSHAAVIAAFGKEFAKTKILPPRYHRSLRDGFETRQIGDYSLEASVTLEKATQVLKEAKEFFTASKKYMASQSPAP